jgi:hypothetical protein
MNKNLKQSAPTNGERGKKNPSGALLQFPR